MVKRRGPLRLVVFSIAVAAAIVLLLAFELESAVRQRELRRLVTAQGDALAEALGHAVENAIASGREIEELASTRLLDLARLLERLDAVSDLGSRRLDAIAEDLALHRVVIFDRSLSPIRSSAVPPGEPEDSPVLAFGDALRPLVEGSADQIVLGARPVPGGGGTRLGAAVRRERGGAVLVVADARAMLAFEERIGAEHLVDAVSRTGGILWAELRGPDGGRLAGTGPESAEGRPTIEVSRDVEISWNRTGRLRVGLSAAPLEAAYRTSRRRLLVLAVLVFALAGIVWAAVVARRRTRRLLEAQASRTERVEAFGRLAASVAHEVRNPLNAISVGVQRLQREYQPVRDGDGYRRVTDLLRGEIGRIDAIVDRFLSLARPSGVDPRPIDLGTLVDDSLVLLRDGVPEGVRLESVSGSAPYALADPDAVRQILLNLVRNAVEAAEGSGSITIAVSPAPDSVVVEVRDDGPGIAPDDLTRVFDPGFTTRPRGNGLGLAIVHRLVTEMRGTVSVRSSPGAGTTVRIALPIAPEGSTGTESVR